MVVPADWKEVRLGEIYEVKSSKRVLQSEWRQIGVPFFRGREVSELASRGKVNNDLFIDMTHYERLRRSYGVPRIDDILLTAIGTIGNAYRVKTTEPFYFKDASVIWLSGRGGVVGSYVEHWMKSKGFRDQLPSDNGTTVDTLTIGFTAGMRVILPPLKEQEAIAEALSDADAAIESLDALIAKKRDVKQATMQQLLTGRTRLPGFDADWKEVSIGSFTDCKAGGTPSTSVPAYWGGNIRWMSSGELNFKRVREVSGRITQFGLENSSAQLFPADSVLIGLAGQGKTRGTAAINLVSLTTNQSIAAIFPSGKHDSKFLFYVMETKYKELRDLSDGGGGRGGLNLAIIKDVRVTIPELDEQKKISEVLWSMDDELEALAEQVSKLRMVKEGMMQDLLTGKVRLV